MTNDPKNTPAGRSADLGNTWSDLANARRERSETARVNVSSAHIDAPAVSSLKMLHERGLEDQTENLCDDVGRRTSASEGLAQNFITSSNLVLR